jgi:predicted esterase
VIILLHGRGGSAQDLFSVGEALGGPNTSYLAPNAANHSWYPYTFLAPLEENEPYLSSAIRKVEATTQLAMAAGIPSAQIAIVGFSQGACLATEFVARNPRRYAGLIAFTGGLIGPPHSSLVHPGCLSNTPAFFGSGDPDQHVPWERVQRSADVLSLMGADVAIHRYPGMAHTISAAEIEAAREHTGPLLAQRHR